MQTEITQPAVLATDLALTRLLDAYGVRPDMVMGHSLGEYGALVAAGALSLRRRAGGRQRPRPRDGESRDGRQRRHGGGVRARSPRSSGSSPTIDGYVVVANINSTSQAVIGGATDAVERAVAALQAARHQRRAASRSATRSTPRSWRRRASRCKAALRRLDAAAAGSCRSSRT